MKKQFITLFHLSYWGLYLAVLIVLFFGAQLSLLIPPKHISYFLGVGVVFVLLPSVVGFYAAYSLLFKTYLRQRSFWILAGHTLGVVLVIAFVCGGLITLTLEPEFMFKEGYKSFYSEILLIGSIALINGIIGFILKGFISWYDDLKVKEELQQTTHSMELELVKSKLDPHFLFNTINNIDGMMMQDVQVASDYLDKLSTILRFMLYESKAEKIPLTKELEYIQKYIDLQKIRTTNNNFVKYTVEGHHYNHHVPAMLFIPFIENAFKHVDSKKQYQTIKIKISIEADKINFYCQNSYKKTDVPKPKDGGVGNELISKRLDLLYPNRHQMKTNITADSYSVQLTILTNDN